jgi:hypothetical protein
MVALLRPRHLQRLDVGAELSFVGAAVPVALRRGTVVEVAVVRARVCVDAVPVVALLPERDDLIAALGGIGHEHVPATEGAGRVVLGVRRAPPEPLVVVCIQAAFDQIGLVVQVIDVAVRRHADGT